VSGVTDVLLVRLSAMGDLVQSLGAVASLRAVRPDWRLTVVTQCEFAPLLAGVDGVDRVVPFDRRAGLRGVFAVRRALRERRYDVALDLQGNWKSALITRLASARDSIGMDARWRQEPRSRWLLRRTIACDATPHPARAAWELARSVAGDAPWRTAALVASDEELARERAALAQVVDFTRPVRAVVVTRPDDVRSLPPHVVQRLVASHAQPLLLAGPDERDVALDGPSVRHERGELRRLVALGALVAASGGEVVGPDQGATHVLAAAGARASVLVGSQDPRRTAPAAARAFVRPGALACRPCMARRCGNPEGRVCMDFDLADAVEVDAGLPRGDRA